MAIHDDETEFEDLNGQPDEPEARAEFDDLDDAGHAADTGPLTAVEPEGEPGEPGDEEYGQKVQKRINKEVAKRKRLEAEYQAKVAAMEQRLTEVEQRFHAEASQRWQQEQEATLRNLRDRRQAAMDEGDMETYHRLDDEYLDARIKARQTGNSPAQPVVQTHSAQKVPQTMQVWMQANLGWFNGEARNAPKVSVANALFDVLVAEGFDQADPGLYAELDKRLQAAGVKERRARPTATTTAPTPYAGASADRARGFSEQDAAIMRKYGLNPNDPKQRAGYIKDKDGRAPL